MDYSIPNDLSIPEFLRRASLPNLPPIQNPLAPSGPGTGFDLVGKPYGSGFTMQPSQPQLPATTSGNSSALAEIVSRMPASVQQALAPYLQGSLPVQNGQLPVRSLGSDLVKVGRGLGTLAGAARGSLFSPAGVATSTMASVMEPKPLNSGEVPQLVKDSSGTWVPNPAFTGTLAGGDAIPMPQPRPAIPGVPLPQPNPMAQSQANPYQRASDVGAMAQGNPYAAAAAASPAFGAGQNFAPPFSMGQGPQGTNILQALLAKLQGQ